MSSRIIAIHNSKGGVGKTTTAVNLAMCLVQEGQKVLLIDIDPQASATYYLGYRPALFRDQSAFEAMQGDPIQAYIVHTQFGIDLVPSSPDMENLDLYLLLELNDSERFFALRKALAPIASNYDIILIDAGPTFGIITINVLIAADEVLVPVSCDRLALQGLDQQLHNVNRIRRKYNAGLKVTGILPTLLDRSNESKASLDEIRQMAGSLYRIYDPVKVTPAFKESVSNQEPMAVYSPGHQGTAVYQILAREVLNA